MNRLLTEFSIGRRFLSFASLRVIGQGLTFVFPLLIARILAPDAFGAYALGIMIVYLCTALFINASGSPFIVFAGRELADHGTIRSSFTVRLILLAGAVVLFALLTLVFASPLMRFTTLSIPQLGFLFLAYLGLGIRFLFESIFLALNHHVRNATFTIINGVAAIGLALLVHTWMGLTLEAVFVVFFCASFVTAVIMVRQVQWRTLLPLTFDSSLLRDIAGYTKWTMLGAGGVFIIGWGDTLILRFFVPLSEVGTYYLGYQMLKGTIVLIGTIKLYFLPFLARHTENREKIERFLSQKRPRILLFGAVGLVLLMSAVPFFLARFYGDAYTGVTSIALTLLISGFFILYRTFYGTLFEAFKRYRFTQLANLAFVVVNLTLDVVLVIRFGMIGAAIATTITYAGSAVVYEIYYRRYLKPELFAATN